jgi:hypothetical protein
MKALGLTIESSPAQIKQATDAFGNLQDRFRTTQRLLKLGIPLPVDAALDGAKNVAEAIERMGERASRSLRSLRTNVRLNMKLIRGTLGEESAEGKQALAANFEAAVEGIRKSMREGTIATKKGLAAIRGYLSDELQLYGFSIREARDELKPGTRFDAGPDEGSRGPSSIPSRHNNDNALAGGGWIGMPGMVGTDTVPAMLAPGEAVLNRHQQAVIEGLLGGGFLDRLFANVQTPHYLARGGIVPVPGFPGERASSSILGDIASVVRQFGLRLTDAFGAGHKSPGHTVTGTAADFAGPDRAMDAAVRALVRMGFLVGYDGRFGSQRWPGHGPSTVAGGNAHLHVEFGSGGGALAVPEIPLPKILGGGTVGRIAQAALGRARSGAQSMLERASAAALAVPVGGGGGGGVSEAQARSWIAAGLRLAGLSPAGGNVGTILGRARQESGLNPRAVNNWDVNAKRGDPSRGFLQTIMSTFRRYMVPGHGDIWNPIDNTAAAVRYMMARYGHLVGAGPGGYSQGWPRAQVRLRRLRPAEGPRLRPRHAAVDQGLHPRRQGTPQGPRGDGAPAVA